MSLIFLNFLSNPQIKLDLKTFAINTYPLIRPHPPLEVDSNSPGKTEDLTCDFSWKNSDVTYVEQCWAHAPDCLLIVAHISNHTTMTGVVSVNR